MKRERGVWQRRYWEHQIRDDDDLEKHVAYIHLNPVKHGYVARAADWPYSSIHREIAKGIMTESWGGEDCALNVFHSYVEDVVTFQACVPGMGNFASSNLRAFSMV